MICNNTVYLNPILNNNIHNISIRIKQPNVLHEYLKYY